jgi:tyrosyl-tRNA synthetase
MSISDEIMWRYYELLTDVSISEIEKMKRETHPMTAKKDLARRIVTDFHSSEAATKADEDWTKQFQRDQAPEDAEEVRVGFNQVRWSAEDSQHSQDGVGCGPAESRPAHFGIRLDRLLVICGLADSTTDAARKLKQGAVKVNDSLEQNPRIILAGLQTRLTLRVGRRVKVAVIDVNRN